MKRIVLLLASALVVIADDPPVSVVNRALGAGIDATLENVEGSLGQGAARVVCGMLPPFAQTAASKCESPWVPKEGDFVVVTGGHQKTHVGRSGQIIKMGSAQMRKKGQVLVEYESTVVASANLLVARERPLSEEAWFRFPKSSLRKMTSEEVKEYLKKYPEKAPRPPDASTQPPRPTLPPATPQEMETCGRKVFHFVNMTGYAADKKSTLFKTAEQSPAREMIEPEIYDEKALVKLVSATDELLVFAKPGRKRRPETLQDAIGGGGRNAVKVSGAELVELLCGNDGLYEEAQKLPPGKKCENCLRSEATKKRIAEAEAAAEEAAAQKQLASEPQVEIDRYVVRGGHETGDWTTDGSIEKKSLHGDVKCSFTPGYCVPARKSYEHFAVQCDEIEAAFVKSAGGVVPAAEKLVPVFFEQENVRRFARRGYLTNGVTGRALAATRCRAGTKACDQMGAWVYIIVRAASQHYDKSKGLDQFAQRIKECDPKVDGEDECDDRKIAALVVPFMEVGFVRWHATSPKEGTSGGTFVFAGPFWAELEALREARAAAFFSSSLSLFRAGPATQIRDAVPRGSEALVALLSLSVQRGYKPPAYMWCKFGRQAMAIITGGEDLEAAFEYARGNYTDAWIAVLDTIRSGVEMRIWIRWRSQFSEHDVVDVEYVPEKGVFDLGVVTKECLENVAKVHRGEICPQIKKFLDEVAAIAPGPIREEDKVSFSVVANFLRGEVGSSSVLLAGDPTFCVGVDELCLSARSWRSFWVRHLEEWPPWLGVLSLDEGRRLVVSS